MSTHDQEVERETAEQCMQAEFERNLKNAVAYGKMLDKIFEPLEKTVEREKEYKKTEDAES